MTAGITRQTDEALRHVLFESDKDGAPAASNVADIQIEQSSPDAQSGPPGPAIVRSDRTEICPLRATDIPTVARLFKATFRAGIDVPLPGLEAYLQDLFLDGPNCHPMSPSRVCVTADGQISGFIGSLSQPMRLGERRIRAAHASCLMVADPQRDALAGARLLRSFITGAQDLSFSETSNPLSRRMWTRLGGRAVASYSMKWLRILRPAGTAVAFACKRLPPLKVLHPVCTLADRLMSRLPGGDWWQLPPPSPNASVTEVDRAAIAEVIEELIGRYALHPAWSPEQLAYRLEDARFMPSSGPLICCRVTNRKGTLVGGFLYHARRNGLGVVLQILAREDAVGPVIGGLFRDAYERGAVAIYGRTDPLILDELLQANCIVTQREVTTVHSRDPEVLAAITQHAAMLTGLAGESWSQVIGGFTGAAP